MRVSESNPYAITSVSLQSRPGSAGGAVSYNQASVPGGPSTPAVQYEKGSDAARAQEQYIYTSGIYHRATMLNLGDERWTTASNQLHKVEKWVALERPDLAKEAWDFSVQDGKVVVSGDGLSASDKAWIGHMINSTEGLAQAAVDFVALASSYLETTKTNPAYHGTNYLTGGEMVYNFHGTQQALEKAVNFRELSRALHRTFDTGHGRGDEAVGPFSADKAFNYLAATALVASDEWPPA